MNIRGSVPTKISCSRNSDDRRKLHSPFLWFAQSFEILAKFIASFSNYLAYWIGWVFLCKNSEKHGKFTVAELHNKFRAMPCRCCREDTARCAANTLQRHAKTLGRGTKVKSPVPAGRQVGTKSTCNKGKGMRKRETFRTTEGNIFFSNILL